MQRAVQQSRQRAAQGDQGEQDPGAGAAAALLGEGDHRHLHGPEQHPDEEHRGRQRAQAGHGDGPAVAIAERVHRGLGRPLRNEGQRAGRAEGQRDEQPDGRVEHRAEHDDQRAQHEDDLVDDGLPRVGPGQLGRSVGQQLAPPGPRARAELGRGRAHHGGGEQQQRQRRAGRGQQHDGHRAERGHDDRHGQHAALAAPVDQAGHGGPDDGQAQGVRRAHEPGQGVGVPPVLHQQDRPDAQHRDRHAADEAGQAEAERPGCPQQGAVPARSRSRWGGHDDQPSRRHRPVGVDSEA